MYSNTNLFQLTILVSAIFPPICYVLQFSVLLSSFSHNLVMSDNLQNNLLKLHFWQSGRFFIEYLALCCQIDGIFKSASGAKAKKKKNITANLLFNALSYYGCIQGFYNLT